MDTAYRNQSHSCEKPYDVEIEYLQSSSNGQAYIDFNISLPVIFNAKLDLHIINCTQGCVGTYDLAGQGLRFTNHGSGTYLDWDGTNQRIQSTTVPNNVRYDVEFGNFYFKVYDQAKQLVASASQADGFWKTPPPGTLSVFRKIVVDPHGIEYTCNMRFYSLHVSDENGRTLLDAIPVKADGEGCIYDRVSNCIFKNAGTGSFICGPAVKGNA